MSKQGFVYILASRRNGTLYVGVTSNLIQRIAQHREGLVEGFTKRYHVKTLVWYQHCDEISGAIFREIQIKEWKRQWKIDLIQEHNPYWKDLYPELVP